MNIQQFIFTPFYKENYIRRIILLKILITLILNNQLEGRFSVFSFVTTAIFPKKPECNSFSFGSTHQPSTVCCFREVFGIALRKS